MDIDFLLAEPAKQLVTVHSKELTPGLKKTQKSHLYVKIVCVVVNDRFCVCVAEGKLKLPGSK